MNEEERDWEPLAPVENLWAWLIVSGFFVLFCLGLCAAIGYTFFGGME